MLEPTGATYEIDHDRGVPPVVNDEQVTALLAATAASTLGRGAVVPTEQSAGGDDFAWYAELVPSTYARLGVHDPTSTGPRQDLHASTFDVDERAIEIGVRVLVDRRPRRPHHPAARLTALVSGRLTVALATRSRPETGRVGA